MKATDTPPLLSLRVTDVAAMDDIYLVVEPGAERFGGSPTLIVHSMSRTWCAALPDADPLGALARMGPAKLREALEYSRPTSRLDSDRMRDLMTDMCAVIPLAVQQHLYINRS